MITATYCRCGAMFQIDLQIFQAGKWLDAMRLALEKPELSDAERLRALPDLLAASGLPAATFRSPGVHLQRLDPSLATWGLL